MSDKYNTVSEREYLPEPPIDKDDVQFIPVTFRFPVQRHPEDANTVLVKVVWRHNGESLITLNGKAVEAWDLSDSEVDKAVQAAQQAVVRAIMIKES
jgi:hypothetical protein